MSPPGATAVAVALGLLMVAATGVQLSGPGLIGAVAAAAAVVVSIVWRPAATAAVVISALLIAFTGTAPVLAALSGLAALGYLLLRHPSDRVNGPAVTAAAGFAVVGAVAASIPLQLPLVPLLAPAGVIAIYLLVVRPFLAR